MTQRFVPWRTVSSEEVVEATPWLDPAGQPVPEVVSTWYVGLPFVSERVVRVLDPGRLELETGLKVPDLLAAVEWEFSTTKLRGATSPVPLAAGDVKLRVEVPAEEAGGVVTLRTLLLAQPASGVAYAPTESACAVWESADRFILEGGAPQFAVAHRPFSETVWHPNALFAVEVEVDAGLDAFERPYSEVIRLVFNSEHKLAPSVSRLDDKDRIMAGALAWAKADIARAILLIAADIDSWSKSTEERFDPMSAKHGTAATVHTLEELCYVTSLQVLGTSSLEAIRGACRDMGRLGSLCQGFAGLGA